MKTLRSAVPEQLRGRVYEIVLFVLVGFLNTVVDFVVLNLLVIMTHHDDGLWLIAFTCLGFLAAVLNSYILNRNLTFRGQGDRSSSHFIRFIAVNAVGMVINSSIVWFLVLVIGDRLSALVAINASKLLAVTCSLTWNYFAIKRWVFNGQPGGRSQQRFASQEICVTQLEKEAEIKR